MYSNNGQIYFVSDRIADEKNVKYGGPEVMQLEDFGLARRGRARLP